MADSDTSPVMKKDIQGIMILLTKMNTNITKNTEDICKMQQRLNALDSDYFELSDRVDKVEKKVEGIDPVLFDTSNKVTLSEKSHAALLKRVEILEATVEFQQKIGMSSIKRGQCDLASKTPNKKCCLSRYFDHVQASQRT